MISSDGILAMLIKRYTFRWSRVLQRKMSVTLFARFYTFKRRLIKWSGRLQASTGYPLGLMTLQVYGLKKRYTYTFFTPPALPVLSLVQLRAT